MIRTIADLLEDFMLEEAKILDQFDIKNNLAIGSMYEGLSADILERIIPEELELKIIRRGFIYNDVGCTGEIDCMLVRGNGIQIPYTELYKWHIKDVLVVFEVKKTLYSKELIESFKGLRKVSSAYSHYLFKEDKNIDENKEVYLYPMEDAFSRMTGIYAPSYFNRTSLSLELQLIYHTLITEQLSPIRVVLGYKGFKTEYSLRQALLKFLEDEGLSTERGIQSTPHLITCNGHSLVKCNGNPYLFPLEDEWWHFLASTSENPLLLLIKLIWTKISREFDVSMPWGEDFEFEKFNKFISAKPTSKEGTLLGWDFRYIEINKNLLSRRIPPVKWEPIELNGTQFTIISYLCLGRKEFVDNSSFIQYVQGDGYDLYEFVKSLVETRLVALDGNELKLLTEKCECMIVRGRFLAGENADGRFTRWLQDYL